MPIPASLRDHLDWVCAAWPTSARQRVVLGLVFVGLGALLLAATLHVAPRCYEGSASFKYRLTDTTPAHLPDPAFAALMRDWQAQEQPMKGALLYQNQRERLAILSVTGKTAEEADQRLDAAIADLSERYAAIALVLQANNGTAQAVPVPLSRNPPRAIGPDLGHRLLLVTLLAAYGTLLVALAIARTGER